MSRALHDNPRVSVATRERIKKIAAELEFEFNSHARSLSTSRSGTVCVVVPNFGREVWRTYYLDLLISEIRARLKESGLDLLIADSGPEANGKSTLRRLVLQKKVDGIIIIIADLAEIDREFIGMRGIPVVAVNSKPQAMAGKSLDEFSWFYTDNVAGGALAARHLAARGSTRLICLADAEAPPEMLDRTRGFAEEASRRGLDPLVLQCPVDFPGVRAFIAERIDAFRQADGLFCHTDVMACAALQALGAAGLRVRDDIRVVGYDDIDLGTYFTPRLSTVHQPREEIARLACERLTEILRAGDGTAQAVHMSVAPSMVQRESS